MALVKCEECGKEISDTARKCVNCGASTKKNKALIKAIKVLIIIVVIAISVIITCYLITINRNSYKYGKEAISILNSYKSNLISKSDAEKQLDNLYGKIDKEIDDFDSDSNEYHRLFMIKLKILGANIDFISPNGVSIFDIDDAIIEIKEYMHFFS